MGRLKKPRLLYTHKGEVGDEVELQFTSIGSDCLIQGRSILLEKCVLNRCPIVVGTAIRFVECRLDTVDAANADASEASFRETMVLESRFIGSLMNHSYLDRVTFDRCLMSHIQLQECTMKQARFEGCDLRGAYFNGSQLQGTVFEGSDLTGADFFSANIADCDFRRANIEDIRIAPEQLRGVIVTPDQALYLARLLGLVVKE